MFNVTSIPNYKRKIIITVIVIILIVGLVVWYRRRYKKRTGEMATLDSKKLKTELTRQGIDNKYLQAGILGVVEEETGGVPKSEYSYANTDSTRLKTVIFTTKLKNYSIDQIDILKKDNVKFYDIIYGGMYGNNNAGDGWLYRGRGYNGLTFKGNYIKYANLIGIDIVKYPDKVNETEVAGKILAVYMKENVPNAVKYNIVGSIDKIKTLELGTEIALRSNAGKWDNSFNTTFMQSRYKVALTSAKKYV